MSALEDGLDKGNMVAWMGECEDTGGCGTHVVVTPSGASFNAALSFTASADVKFNSLLALKPLEDTTKLFEALLLLLTRLLLNCED